MSQEKRVEALERKAGEGDDTWSLVVDWTEAGEEREPVEPGVKVVEWDQDETTRLCPHCTEPVTRGDEASGKCPACGGPLLTLVPEEGERESKESS